MSAAFPKQFGQEDHVAAETMRDELIYRALRLAHDDDSLTPLIEDCQRVLREIMTPMYLVPGPDHIGRQLEAAFDRTCIALELAHVQRPGELSCYDFYSRVAYLEKRGKPSAAA